MRRILGALVLGLLLAVPSHAHPEIYVPQAPGPKPIRVQARQVGWRRPVAGLGYVRADTVIFLRHGASDTVAIPLRDVRRLQVANGYGSLGGEGAGVGLVVGVLAGVVYGKTSTDPSALHVFLNAMGFGFLGALSGGAVGSNTRVQGWRDVEASDLRVAFEPRAGGATLRLAVRF